MAVPGAVPPSTQMPASTRGRLEYRSIKLPKHRLTEQYFSDIIGGHFAMRQPLGNILKLFKGRARLRIEVLSIIDWVIAYANFQ